jgi:hypothetical protein
MQKPAFFCLPVEMIIEKAPACSGAIENNQ